MRILFLAFALCLQAHAQILPPTSGPVSPKPSRFAWKGDVNALYLYRTDTGEVFGVIKPYADMWSITRYAARPDSLYITRAQAKKALLDWAEEHQ